MSTYLVFSDFPQAGLVELVRLRSFSVHPKPGLRTLPMRILKKDLQIAIDGPSGSGKSTLAKILAKRLKISCFNSGATFRAVALLALRNGLDFESKKICQILRKADLRIHLDKTRNWQIFLDRENVGRKLFSPRLDWGASCVATLPQVRKILVSKWQKIAQGKSIVIEGRDIGQVFSKADLKIYLTADLKVRIKRVWAKLKKKGIKRSFREVAAETKKRDRQDSRRKINPLKFSSQYWFLDNSNLKPKEEVKLVIKKLKEMKLIC